MDNDYEIKMYAAIIAGTVSLIVSIIALVKSISISKLNAISAKEVEKIKSSALYALENHKIQSDKREKSVELAALETSETVSHVEQLWSNLQKIKESIDLIDSPVIGRREKSISDISMADTAINELYTLVGGKLPEEIRVVAHEVKNMTRTFCAAVNTVDELTDSNSNLSDLSSHLAIYKKNFTSFQESLKERKSEYIDRRAEEIYISLIKT